MFVRLSFQHRYYKSLCMQMCFHYPNKISKGHFVPRGGTMLYLEFPFHKRGDDIFQLPYSSIGIIFSGELLWQNGHIVISHYFT